MRRVPFVREVPHRAARASPSRVTILLPARNEEAGLSETLARLPVDDVRALGHDVEVVVVDGHSSDGTREAARRYGARVLVQPGKGKGDAVRMAFRVLDSDYVVMLDADSTYPEDRIPRFVRYLDAGFDVVMGSRLSGTIHEGAMSGTNRFGNWALSTLATALYGRRCTDVCTGLWGFNREAMAALPLRSDGFEIEAEMYAESVKAGLNVVEVPIEYRARAGDTKLNKLGDGYRIARALVECRVRDGGFRGGRDALPPRSAPG